MSEDWNTLEKGDVIEVTRTDRPYAWKFLAYFLSYNKRGEIELGNIIHNDEHLRVSCIESKNATFCKFVKQQIY